MFAVDQSHPTHGVLILLCFLSVRWKSVEKLLVFNGAKPHSSTKYTPRGRVVAPILLPSGRDRATSKSIEKSPNGGKTRSRGVAVFLVVTGLRVAKSRSQGSRISPRPRPRNKNSEHTHAWRGPYESL